MLSLSLDPRMMKLFLWPSDICIYFRLTANLDLRTFQFYFLSCGNTFKVSSDDDITHRSLLTSQPIILLVSDCSLADKKTSDLIGYLLPIASNIIDCTTVAERTNHLIGCEARRDLRECRPAKGTLKVVPQNRRQENLLLLPGGSSRTLKVSKTDWKWRIHKIRNALLDG